MTCVIDWCGMDWQAFATLFTGVIAVGGATIIGVKQTTIARRQVEIAERQTAIAEAQAASAESQSLTAKMAQRADVFDLRFGVYSEIEKFIGTSLSGDFDQLTALDRSLKEALQRAQFLFPQSVRDELKIAFALADECALINSESQLALSDARKNRRRVLRKKLREILRTLAKTMGEEIRLFNT
jgi:hypothetical protein